MTNPTAAIVVIGDEILSGRTKDRNIGWLAEQLNAQGIQLREARVIPDIREVIIDVPGLIFWQHMEGRALLRRRRATAESPDMQSSGE